jgi:hypothetical protein
MPCWVGISRHKPMQGNRNRNIKVRFKMLVTLVPPTLLLSCLYFLLGHFSKVQCDIVSHSHLASTHYYFLNLKMITDV